MATVWPISSRNRIGNGGETDGKLAGLHLRHTQVRRRSLTGAALPFVRQHCFSQSNSAVLPGGVVLIL